MESGRWESKEQSLGVALTKQKKKEKLRVANKQQD